MIPYPKRTLLLLSSAVLATTACVTPPERPSEPVNTLAAEQANEQAAKRDRQIALLQLKLLTRDADIVRLQSDIDEVKQQLDDAVLEIVRSKAKMGSIGSRAEAATSLSESELLLASLRRERGVAANDISAAQKLLALGNTEFKNGNFGGAFYLSSSAKTTLGIAASRLRSAVPAADAGAETRFLTPIKFRFSARAKTRELPRVDSRVLRVADEGTEILGLAHRDRWVLIEFADGMRGWSFHDLLTAR